jgi:hypothetical protein
VYIYQPLSACKITYKFSYLAIWGIASEGRTVFCHDDFAVGGAVVATGKILPPKQETWLLEAENPNNDA